MNQGQRYRRKGDLRGGGGAYGGGSFAGGGPSSAASYGGARGGISTGTRRGHQGKTANARQPGQRRNDGGVRNLANFGDHAKGVAFGAEKPSPAEERRRRKQGRRQPVNTSNDGAGARAWHNPNCAQPVVGADGQERRSHPSDRTSCVRYSFVAPFIMPRGVVPFRAAGVPVLTRRPPICVFFLLPRAGTGTTGRRGFWQGNNRVSKRLDAHRSSDPFARAGKQKTSFAVCYNSGGIPCRLDHGAVQCRLRWDRAPAELGPSWQEEEHIRRRNTPRTPPHRTFECHRCMPHTAMLIWHGIRCLTVA